MRYPEALDYLASVERLGIKLALQNISQVLAALGDPQTRFPGVLISGSNGKGSVAAMLAAILTRAGYRAGLYTSPHLVRYEERIAVDGRPVTAEVFAGAVGRVRETVDRLLAEGTLTAHPTHFEILTAAAFAHFAAAGVRAAVLEVGMGGRLDATVLAVPRLSVVTNISLEHTSFLGTTVPAIAREKAGILPEGGLLLSGESDPGALEVFRARAREVGGRLVELDRYATWGAGEGGRWWVETPRRRHPSLELGLQGPYQRRNAVLAVAASDLLEEIGFGVPAEAIRGGLRRPGWPGRFQIVEGSPRMIFDAAHNPAGCAALREALEASGLPADRVTLLFGVLRDKDHAIMLRALAPAARRVVVTRGASPRFRDPHTLLPEAQGLGMEVLATDSAEEGLRVARDATPPDGALCVCGSLYLVGDIMHLVGIEPFPSS